MLLTTLPAGTEAALSLHEVDRNFTEKLCQPYLSFICFSTSLVIISYCSKVSSHHLLLFCGSPHTHCHICPCTASRKRPFSWESCLCLCPAWELLSPSPASTIANFSVFVCLSHASSPGWCVQMCWPWGTSLFFATWCPHTSTDTYTGDVSHTCVFIRKQLLAVVVPTMRS